MTPVQADTIAALATGPGAGALAVVRWSGPGAAALLTRLVPGRSGDWVPRRATLVTLIDPVSGGAVDSGLVTWFPGPASMTGEDVVEFSGHGGRIAPALVLEAVIAAGARLAEPGEFTRRAYLNGKIDLVQAEAVGDLVAARSRALHRQALRHLDRGLSERLARVRDGVLGLEVMLAHHVDFPEEDDAPVPIADIVERAEALMADLSQLAATAPAGERLRSGALVVLAGRPNAGKSSLFNALLGEARALVTEVPGTTRDALEAEVELGGFPVRLVDTAGLRDEAGEVERLGIEVARRFVDAADLILFCVPAGRGPDRDERSFVEAVDPQGARTLWVRTMSDRGCGEWTGDGQLVEVSSQEGTGLGELSSRVARHMWGALPEAESELPLLTRERQVRGVRRAVAELEAFLAAARDGVPAEIAALHLRDAESALEEVIGRVDHEEVLDRLFASFCIGK